MVLMGVYGPVEPGTHLEAFAEEALRNQQQEKVAEVNLLVTALAAGNSEDTKHLNNAIKQYLRIADPIGGIARKKKDRQMKQRLKDEVARGAFAIEPIGDYDKGTIKLREQPRLNRRQKRELLSLKPDA